MLSTLFAVAVYAALSVMEWQHYQTEKTNLQAITDSAILEVMRKSRYDDAVPKEDLKAFMAAHSEHDILVQNFDVTEKEFNLTLQRPHRPVVSRLFGLLPKNLATDVTAPKLRNPAHKLNILLDVREDSFLTLEAVKLALDKAPRRGAVLQRNGKIQNGNFKQAAEFTDPNDFILYITDDIEQPGLCDFVKNHDRMDMVWQADHNSDNIKTVRTCKDFKNFYACGDPEVVPDDESLTGLLQYIMDNYGTVRVTC